MTITSDRDQVRLRIGDTDATNPLFQDDEIDYFLASRGNVLLAAADAAGALAATFATADFTEKTVGDLTIRKSDAGRVAEGYRGLATTLRRMAATGVAPYAGGISDSDKRGVEADTDRVRPAFFRRIFDNREVLSPIGGGST